VEINYAALDTYECCKAQGAWLRSISRPATIMDRPHDGGSHETENQPRRRATLGPSGAPIWSTPAIDAKRNLLYVAPREQFVACNGHLGFDHAFDLNSGERSGYFRPLKRRVELCVPQRSELRFRRPGGDRRSRFRRLVMIVKRADGRDVLVVGQKSGTVWRLIPTTTAHWCGRGNRVGAQRRHSLGHGNGRDSCLRSMNDREAKPELRYRSGLHALDLATGKILWSRKAEGDCSGDRKQRFAACDSRLAIRRRRSWWTAPSCRDRWTEFCACSTRRPA